MLQRPVIKCWVLGRIVLGESKNFILPCGHRRPTSRSSLTVLPSRWLWVRRRRSHWAVQAGWRPPTITAHVRDMKIPVSAFT